MNADAIIGAIFYAWRLYKLMKQGTSLMKGVCIGMAAGAAALTGVHYMRSGHRSFRKSGRKALKYARSLLDEMDGLLRK